MKYFVLFSFLLFSKLIFSQPSDYYDLAKDKKGDELKLALHEIIKGHVQFPYTSSSTDVWDILKLTDRDTFDTTLVELIYSGGLVDGAQEYNSGNGWTREHVWAKSRGDFGTSPGPGTDVHALRPCHTGINSTRNNRAFDNCSSCKNVEYLGTNTGSYTDNNLWIFEPRDEMKGDVARMIFYMATRYEQEDGVDLELDDVIRDNTDKSPNHSVLSTLLIWNESDTVSEKEKRRNDIIYDKFQKNRNPFIDHPELANYIFGGLQNEKWMELVSVDEKAKSSSNCLEVVKKQNSNYSIKNISQSNQEIILTDIKGSLIQQNSIERLGSIDIYLKPNTVYFIKSRSCNFTYKLFNPR